jgi:hypothetical protein
MLIAEEARLRTTVRFSGYGIICSGVLFPPTLNPVKDINYCREAGMWIDGMVVRDTKSETK